ncbi:MAG: hypothetical protein ABIG29_03540 [Candidatus Nealsonbacteria bacterium]
MVTLLVVAGTVLFVGPIVVVSPEFLPAALWGMGIAEVAGVAGILAVASCSPYNYSE